MARDLTKLYGGRHYPDGRSAERHPRPTHEDHFHRHREEQRNQFPEDEHDESLRYSNDHAFDWVRGGNEDATTRPGFDKGQDGQQSWRAGRERSLDWKSGHRVDRFGDYPRKDSGGRIDPPKAFPGQWPAR